MPIGNLTSIIILGYNELQYTKLCIDSIYRHTMPPFELILVDNGSTDRTAEYFDTIAGAKVIKNTENLGFAKGCNQGIQVAEGKYILLLNNDTIATNRWLDNLIECAESDPAIGIVGPRSNYVAGPQFIEANYSSLEDLDRFSREFNRQGRDKWFDLDVAIGFCMLIKREAVEKIGLFDEQFGLGNFEDNDLSMRAKRAGYRLVCAGNTFIHHFGSRTFLGNNLSYTDVFERNRLLFKDKWSSQESRETANQRGQEKTSLTTAFHRGLTLYVDGNYDEAMKKYEDLLRELPASVYLKHAIGLTCMMQGKFVEAKEYFASALGRQSDNGELLLAYGDCLTVLGELDSAEMSYESALEIYPESGLAQLGLAAIDKIRSQPKIAKFIKNVDALINLKNQLAREQDQQLSVTCVLAEYDSLVEPHYYVELVKRLIKAGHHISVVSYGQWPEQFDAGATVSMLTPGDSFEAVVPAGTDILLATHWAQLAEGIDLVQDIQACLIPADRCVLEGDTAHDVGNTDLRESIGRAFTLPVPLLSTSESMRRLIKRRFNRESDVIPYALDTGAFKPRRRRKRQKRKVLVVASGAASSEGLESVNQALMRVKEDRDIEVVGVSLTPDVGAHVACETFIQAPSHEELVKLYTESDVLIHVPEHETLSLVLLQAMACGAAVITTVNEGSKRYLRDSKDCLTVPVCNADALYDAVNRLFNDDLLRERLVKGAFETVARFTWNRTISMLEDRLWYLALCPALPYTAVLPEESVGEAESDASNDSAEPALDGYYRFERSDIKGLVPTHAKRVLDVGCAAGLVGKGLKERGTIEVVGVEIIEEVAAQASKHLDRVIVGNIEQLELDFDEGYFDCIILADVLEHLCDPWGTLTKLKHYLAPDGKVVLSIPNVGHISILRDLLRGSWQYKEAGILDITHLRFFTLESALELLLSAGFTVESVHHKTYATQEEHDLLKALCAQGFIDQKNQQEMSAWQFLLTAAPQSVRKHSESFDIPQMSSQAGAASKGGTNELNTEVAVPASYSAKQAKGERARLSLAMIVKNEADTLQRCLQSVQGVVDEIIIVDTGSTDDTVAIAQGFGAKIYHHAWNNDFAEARNVSLEHATGEWILFLDADEELVIEDRGALLQLLNDIEHEGFFVNELNFVGEKEAESAVVNIAFRLWRNRPEYRFTGAIHEQIVAKVQARNPDIGFSSVRVNHYGYLNTPTAEKGKIERNLSILLKEVEKYPEDPFVRFNLGVEYLRQSKYEEALDEYKKAFANLSCLEAAYASVLIRNIALCLKELKRNLECLKVLKDAKEAYPDYTDLFYLEGLAHLAERDYVSAIEAFETCLRMGPAAKQHISQTGVGGYMAAHALGEAYQALGDEGKAVVSYKRALQENPRNCLSLMSLGLMLTRRERPDELKRFLESLVDLTSADVLYTLAVAFARGGYNDESLRYLEIAHSSGLHTAQLTLLHGECLLNLNRYREAIAEFEGIAVTSQFYPTALVDRAVCHILIGEHEPALATLAQLQDFETFKLIRKVYAVIIDVLTGRQVSSAIADDERGSAYRILADYLRKLLELEEFEQFETATAILDRLNFAPGEANLLLGKIYYDANFNEMAVEELIRAYELGCADGEAFFILGRTALNNQFYDEAKTFFYEALASGVDELGLYISLARTLTKLGDIEEAVNILKAGSKRYPISPLLQEVKKSISLLV